MIRLLAVLLTLAWMPLEGQDTVGVRSGHAACHSRSDVMMLEQILAVDTDASATRWYSVARQKVIEGRCIFTDSTWRVVVVSTDDTTGLWSVRLTETPKRDTTLWIGREAIVERE